jgi:O-antigen/teichoic acid export membrane protein
VVATVVAFVATPITVAGLGASHYGLMVLLTAVLVPLGLTNFGLSQATVKFVAEANARGDQRQAEAYIGTTLLFNFVVGLAGSAAIVVIAGPLLPRLFQMTPDDAPLARACLYWIAAGWTVNQLAATANAVPVAIQRYDVAAAGTTAASVLTTGFALAGLFLRGGLLAFVQGQFIGQVLAMIIWFAIARRVCPGVSLAPRWDRRAFRSSFSFGAWQTVANVGGLVAGQTDKYILGAFLPTATVGLYNIALTVEQRVYSLAFRMSEVLFPAFSHLQVSGSAERESNVLMRSSWLLTVFGAGMLAPLAVWGRDFLSLWVGPGTSDQTYRVLQVLALGGLLGSATNAGYHYLLGVGRTTWTAMISITTGAVVLGGSLLLVPRLGLEGAAWSGVAAMVVQAAMVTYMWHVLFPSHAHWPVYVTALYGPVVTSVATTWALLAVRNAIGLPPLSWVTLPVAAGLTTLLIVGMCVGVDRFLPGGDIRTGDVTRILQHGRAWALRRLVAS